MPTNLDLAFEALWMGLPRTRDFLAHRVLLYLAVLREPGTDALLAKLIGQERPCEVVSAEDIAEARQTISKLLVYEGECYRLFHDRFKHFLVGEQSDPVATAFSVVRAGASSAPEQTETYSMSRIRRASVGQFHAHVATTFCSLCEEGREFALTKLALPQVAYHVDVAARARDDQEALFDLLDASWYALAMRRSSDGGWREAADLHRLAISARDWDRVDQFALAVQKREWMLDFLGPKLSDWRAALTAHDVEALRGLAMSLQRTESDPHGVKFEPSFWRVLLAVACAKMQRLSEPPASLLMLLAQQPVSMESLDLELAAHLLMQAQVCPMPSWATAGARPCRRAMMCDMSVCEPLPGEVVNARDAFADNPDAREMLAVLEQWCLKQRYQQVGLSLAAMETFASDPRLLGPLTQVFEHLPSLTWTDSGVREVVSNLNQSLLLALVESGWDAVQWAIDMLRRIESDYYRCLHDAAFHLVQVLKAPALQRRLFEALLEHAMGRTEASARHRLSTLASFCLVRHLELTVSSFDEDDLELLAALERTLLPAPDCDFLELALTRAAGQRRDLPSLEKHFRAISNQWLRGQALIRQPDDVAGNPQIWPLVLEISHNGFAVALSLRKFTETLRDEQPVVERMRRLLLLIAASSRTTALAPTDLASTLVESAAYAPDRAEALRILGEWLAPLLFRAASNVVREVLLATLECNIAPSEWTDPMRRLLAADTVTLAHEERRVLGGFPIAYAWGLAQNEEPVSPSRWATWDAVVSGLLSGLLPAQAPSPNVLVAITNAAMVQNEAWAERLPHKSMGWLKRNTLDATPTPQALRLCLVFGSKGEEPCGADPFRYGIELGAKPTAFDPEEALRRGGALWRTLFRWMHENASRSEILVKYARHPAVHDFLLGCEEAVHQSSHGRPYRELGRPGRRALLWMGAAWFERRKPTIILAGELSYRCATTDEHERIEAWLAARQGGCR
ncbi:MAG: hypothetical protein RBU37_18660 [Myxococcota bacterium]|jgi:hypothetical protein|nr:hypothetical protein [Myxococcota bacterium]